MKKSLGVLDQEKVFLQIFKELCYSRNSWQVWADIITVIACSLSNVIDKIQFDKREKEYKDSMKRLEEFDKVVELYGIVVNALDKNPNQDFLGSIYMQLELGNHWTGQFFTPIGVSQLMANITLDTNKMLEQINDKGYITINDPAVGAGVTLITAVNAMREQDINYQQKAFIVGQDIDRIVGMMAYIQLSLLGCAGYIAIADSLTNPLCGNVIDPYQGEGQEFWFMPLYFTEVWNFRRVFQNMNQLVRSGTEINKVKSRIKETIPSVPIKISNSKCEQLTLFDMGFGE